MGCDQTYACCERVERDPQERFWSVQSVCFCISSHLCSLCCWWHVPPTDKLLGLCCVFVCVWVFASACVCARAPLLQHTHLHFIHVGKIFFLPSELLSPCFADKQKQGGAVLWGLVQGLGGGVGLCCRFMWHRQNITRCRCNHAVCFALRYCSNKGCDGKARKCLSPSPLKFSLSTFSSNNPSLQPVSEPSESKTVHTQKHSSGTRACEERSTNNRHEA